MGTVHDVSNDDIKEEQEEQEESLYDREGDDGTKHERYQGLTRSQHDIFHQLHKLPLKKNCEATAFFYQMILAATWINNQEDYSNIVTALQNNHNVEDIAAHKFFNRGYWRQHVRRLTPTPENHAGNLEKVKSFVSSDNRFKEY
ncbi:unnamed protein product [Cylindrotheca closterium]|uniref:Uncharacterized protein n=1 Tax=Cylindrotheca closterium TaxID=2856 RepID=A0AAD2FH25_9STRA|nr:unnamed protein product [Cylindrotheca closterium]